MKRIEAKIRYYLGYFLGLFVVIFFIMLTLRIIFSIYGSNYPSPLRYMDIFERHAFWINFNIINVFITILPLGIALGLLLALRFIEIYGVVADA